MSSENFHQTQAIPCEPLLKFPSLSQLLDQVGPPIYHFAGKRWIRAVFGSCKIFSENAIFGKGKYFQVFGCISKNVLKNIFWCLVLFLKIPQKTHFLLVAHIFSAAKQIYNIIHSSIQKHKQNPEKISSNLVKLREEGRERGDWVRREARSRGAVLRQRSTRRRDRDRCGVVMIRPGSKGRGRSRKREIGGAN